MMKPSFAISEEKRLAYLILKKCGCTSVIAALNDVKDLPRSQLPTFHKNVVISRTRDVANADGLYVFTIVRDPIRRFLSFFSDKIVTWTLNRNTLMKKKYIFGYRENMSLDEAIDIAVSERFRPDFHVVPQSTLIDLTGIELHHIGRFESFDDAIATVNRESGANLSQLFLNRNQCSSTRLNRRQFEVLSSYYKEDQIRFGYPQEYDEWREIYFDQSSYDGQDPESEFVFENEATLVSHQIVPRDDCYELSLQWRLHNGSSRCRFVRLVNLDEENRRTVLYCEPPKRLCSENDQQTTSETLRFNYSNISSELSLKNTGIEIYFWSESNCFAALQKIKNNDGRLLLGLPIPSTALGKQEGTG